MSLTIISKFFLLIILSLVLNYAYSQKEVINMFTNSTVLIRHERGSGSGVVVADTNAVYLISARHVLIDVNKLGEFSLIANQASIYSYKKDAFAGSRDSFKLNLNYLTQNGDLIFDPKNDVVILRLAKVTSHKMGSAGFLSVTEKYSPGIIKLSNASLPGIYIDFLVSMDEVNPGDDAFMFGYPQSLKVGTFDYDYERPLLRKGIVAGIDKNLQTIIVDCPSYQGNSGGPVFEFGFRHEKISLIGIVSRSVLLVERMTNQYYQYDNINVTNSGYTVVIPMQIVKNLITLFKEC